MNPLLNIDGYKLDHRRQYPEGTEYVYSNWTPRASRVPEVDEVVFVGLQYFLIKYLQDEWELNFFDRDVDLVCFEYAEFVNRYLGPNDVGTDHIRALHELGYLPLRFRAVPEGMAVPLRVPMLTIENTHPDFAWLVNYFETILSNILWMPCTSATTARRYRKILENGAYLSGSAPEFVDWQAHDFSFRGLPGLEAAELSGLGHLTYFTGTDSIPAIEAIDEFYGRSKTDTIVGMSVAATEHSVMCAGGKTDERETFARLIDLYPAGILSVVSDTWDLWKVLTDIVPSLKNEILAREGKLVIRPDSGDPVKILVGDNNAPKGSPANKGVIELLHDTFGGTTNAKGFITLDSHVGAIYGDSITPERAKAILGGLRKKGFAADNIVFGVGSYTYQYTTRDTYGFAMKATWVQIDGESMPIFKDPVTDNGIKKSATGRLAVVHGDHGRLAVIENATPMQEAESVLEVVWEDGDLLRYQTIEDVRHYARLGNTQPV